MLHPYMDTHGTVFKFRLSKRILHNKYSKKFQKNIQKPIAKRVGMLYTTKAVCLGMKR